jgi:hypothetical protein
MTDQTQPWDRQPPGESELMHARLRAYLDLGPGRTLAALAEALAAAGDPVTMARLTYLAARNRWDARAVAYDRRPPPPPKPFTLAPGLDPWERQPGESDLMYSRFAAYLQLGRTRTLTSAAEILTSTGDDAKLHGVYIRELSARFRWVERVGAYDREQERLERERLVEQRLDMIRRHRKIANDLGAKAKQALEKLVIEKITPLDMVRMFRLAATIEATALGMPFETLAVTGPAGSALLVDDLSQYTPDERRQRLADIAAQLHQRAGAPVDDMTTEDE